MMPLAGRAQAPTTSPLPLKTYNFFDYMETRFAPPFLCPHRPATLPLGWESNSFCSQNEPLVDVGSLNALAA